MAGGARGAPPSGRGGPVVRTAERASRYEISTPPELPLAEGEACGGQRREELVGTVGPGERARKSPGRSRENPSARVTAASRSSSIAPQ